MNQSQERKMQGHSLLGTKEMKIVLSFLLIFLTLLGGGVGVESHPPPLPYDFLPCTQKILGQPFLKFVLRNFSLRMHLSILVGYVFIKKSFDFQYFHNHFQYGSCKGGGGWS